MMSSFSFGRQKAVKSIVQAETMECGLACLAMIANYHQHAIDLPYLRSIFKPALRGMTLAEIFEVAQTLNLDAQGLAITQAADLAKVKCPALLHWNGNHYVVLEKVVGGKFHVHDPAFGLRIYDLDDIQRHFSGVAMEFQPRVDFQAIKIARKSTLWTVFKSCRGLEHTILLIASVSLAANLFSLATPIFLEIALDSVIPQYDLDLLTIVAIGMLLFSLFDAAAHWLRDTITLRAATLFEIFFTRNVVGHAFRLPLSYFETRHPGDFVTRLTSIDHVKTFIVSGFVSSVADGLMSVVMVGLMYYYSPVMTFVSIMTLVCAIISRVATYPQIAGAMNAMLEARSEEQGRMLDGLRRVETLKVHNTTMFFDMKWFESFSRYANLSFRTKKLSIDTDLLLHSLFAIGTVVTVYIGVTDVMKSVASIGILYAFFALRSAFFNNMNSLIMNLLQVSIMKVHFERLNDVLDEKPEKGEPKGALDRAIRRNIALENVTIDFGAGGQPLLSDVNLTLDIAGAETIAIYGESGCGKSSLLKVLASLSKPTSGRLLVDGKPLDQFGLHEYRANLGVAFADDGLFAGTVAENISMFSPDVTLDQMHDALEFVGLLGTIYALPQKMTTLISDEAAILSTGQRKRLVLARALCRNPRLLLLDEISANLDRDSEAALVDSLMDLPVAKVFVTHSPSLLARVDRVYAIRNGMLQEMSRQGAEVAKASENGRLIHADAL